MFIVLIYVYKFNYNMEGIRDLYICNCFVKYVMYFMNYDKFYKCNGVLDI